MININIEPYNTLVKTLNENPGIGITEIMEKTKLSYSTIFDALVQLSLKDMISFEANGYVFIARVKN